MISGQHFKIGTIFSCLLKEVEFDACPMSVTASVRLLTISFSGNCFLPLDFGPFISSSGDLSVLAPTKDL